MIKPWNAIKSFDNRRVAKISEEVSKRQEKPSEEFRIARKERISWRLKITEEKSEEDQMTKQVEETWNHLTIKWLTGEWMTKAKKARTIQDEPTDEIRKARKNRREEEENRNSRRESDETSRQLI